MIFRIPADDSEVNHWLENHFNAFNNAHGYQQVRHSFCFELLSDNDERIGVVKGMINNNWMHVSELFIIESKRGKGFGASMIRYLESYGKENNIVGITLNTLGFQAKDFYIKLGFEIFGELSNFANTQKLYLKKEI